MRKSGKSGSSGKPKKSTMPDKTQDKKKKKPDVDDGSSDGKLPSINASSTSFLSPDALTVASVTKLLFETQLACQNAAIDFHEEINSILLDAMGLLCQTVSCVGCLPPAEKENCLGLICEVNVLFRQFLSCPNPDLLIDIVGEIRDNVPPPYVDGATVLESRCLDAAEKHLRDESWKVQKKRKGASTPPPPPAVEVDDQMDQSVPLADQPETPRSASPLVVPIESQNPEKASATKSLGKVEPFFVQVTSDWQGFIQNLNAKLATPIVATMANDAVKLQTKSHEDFRILQKFLLDGKYQFSSFSPKSERPKKIAIRGLLGCVNPADISSALMKLGFNVEQVTNLRDRTNKRPLNLFLLHLAPAPGWEKIFRISELLSMKVNLKTFVSRGPRQCYRCQRYNHSSWQCHNSARCVKCAGNHLAKECTVPKETKPKCCLCLGEHTANFSGCKFAPKNATKRSDSKKPASAQRPAESETTAPAVSTDSAPSGPALESVVPPPVLFTPGSSSYASVTKKRKRKKRASPAPAMVDNSGGNQSDVIVEEMEDSSAPAQESKEKLDLPSDTINLMKDFVACVNEVRSWYTECSVTDVLKSIKEIKAEMDALCLSRVAAVVRELEQNFSAQSTPESQIQCLLGIFGRHFGAPHQA